MSQPGSFLYRLAKPVCEDITMARVLDSWLADLRFEYATADRWAKRIWIRVVYTAAWFESLCGVLFRSEGVPRAVAFQVGGTIATAILFVIPAFGDAVIARRPSLALLLLPSALAAALSLGSALGVLSSIGRRGTRASRTAVIVVALLCSVTTASLLQWVSPVTNQAFRESYSHRRLLRGFGEMSLTELGAETLRAPFEQQRNVAHRELQVRLASIAAPLALTLCLVTVVGRARFPRASGAVLILAYYVYLSYQRSIIRPDDNVFWMLAVLWTPALLLLVFGLTTRCWSVNDKHG
jgi:hypothetical protein